MGIVYLCNTNGLCKPIFRGSVGGCCSFCFSGKPLCLSSHQTHPSLYCHAHRRPAYENPQRYTMALAKRNNTVAESKDTTTTMNIRLCQCVIHMPVSPNKARSMLLGFVIKAFFLRSENSWLRLGFLVPCFLKGNGLLHNIFLLQPASFCQVCARWVYRRLRRSAVLSGGFELVWHGLMVFIFN